MKKFTVTKPPQNEAGGNQVRRPRKIMDIRVETLYRSGALKNRVNAVQEYDVDVTDAQEMKWRGHNIMNKRTGIIYHRCRNRPHQFGTGLAVNK
jgi:hypothetical protein